MNRTRPIDALGLTFEVQTGDAGLTAYLERLYGSFPEPESARHRYVLEGSTPGNATLWFDDDRVGDAEHAESHVSTLVHDLNRRALDGSGHLILHAGGVERDGVGVVLPGAMEAGKTTLTAGLVRAGFGYLTDEGVAVDRDTLRIHPYPKPFSIDQGAWPLFPELEPEADLASDAYKANQWQVAPADIRADALGKPCAIALIVFTQYEDGAVTSVERLGRAEALVELAKNTYKFDVQGAPALEVLADVVRRADCYRLESGDLHGAVAAVSDLLATARLAEPDNSVSVR